MNLFLRTRQHQLMKQELVALSVAEFKQPRGQPPAIPRPSRGALAATLGSDNHAKAGHLPQTGSAQ